MQVDPADPTLLVLALPPLAKGVYTVNYKVSSAVDGHANTGYIAFSVGGAELAGASSVGVAKGGLTAADLPELTLRWLNYLGLLVMVGCLGVLLFVLRPIPATGEAGHADEQTYNRVRSRLLNLAMLATGFAFLIGIAQLAWQIHSLVSLETQALSFLELSEQTLFGSQWGIAWLSREILLIVLFVVLYRLKRNPPRELRGYWLAMVLGVYVLIAQSMVSHSAGAQDYLLPVTVNTLHLLFAGFWIGGLIALVICLLPVLLHDRRAFSENVRLAWGPFSVLAAVSVGLVVATGLYSTGSQVISADALLLSPYGRTLTIKILLVLLAGCVGLFNSSLLHPKLAAPLARILKKPPGWTPFRLEHFPWLVLTEVIFGLVILLTVGVLTTLPPARDLAYTVSPEAQPQDVLEPINDLFVTLAIKPNRPGLNLFNIDVLNSRRPAPADILRVIVRMTYLEQDMGTTSQDAQFVNSANWKSSYRLAGSYLTQPGKWSIQVIVRRKGMPDSQVTIPWTVLPLGNIRPRLVSQYPWQALLALGAGIIALLVLLIAGLFWLRARRSCPAQPR